MSDSEQYNMQTPAAQLSPKQQYLNLVMNSLFEFSKICSAPVPTSESKSRIGMLVRMMVAFLPNEETRLELTTFRETEIRNFRKRDNDISNLIDFTYSLDCIVVGKITTVLDQILALSDRQVIMMSGGSDSDSLERMYFPDGVKSEDILQDGDE